ncbi:trans-aconitate 2-methyltransferase [Ulvibacterium sp.]|uniref:class I SAM-dependent methyltransferase n=1 Tax=Ulvibacterium sp. TaxID=2665914 RepID=UPI002606BB0F|nr:class I SAM-dependent methyltransferase [Ulvibacterium sp.]
MNPIKQFEKPKAKDSEIRMEGEYYKTKESVEEYIRLAKDVNGKQLIEKLQHVLEPGSTLLEIGSGPGTDWKILNKSYRVTGSDSSIAFLNHLKTENPNQTFLELDATTLRTDTKFDGLYSNKVLHHLNENELVDSVKRQHEVLQTKGVICHSFWKGKGSEIFKGLFVKYHTKESLKEAFGPYFKILSIESYTEFDQGDSLVLLGAKN